MSKRPNNSATLVSLLAIVLLSGGCDAMKSPTTKVAVASAATRQSRRAYDGAPPVVAHPPQAADCTVCHTVAGRLVPEMGFAPANPHSRSKVGLQTQNCRQCHVFERTKETFAANSFAGLRRPSIKGERLFPGAPPVMPHPLLLRDNCLSCHDGQSARPEIRCSHPQRQNCRQCHVAKVDEMIADWRSAK